MRYYFRYELDKPEPKQDFFEFGSLIHEVLETINKSIVAKSPINLVDALSLYKKLWEKYTINNADYFISGENMISLYYENLPYNVKPEWNILSVEMRFDRVLSNGVPVAGVMDVVYEIGKDSIEIVDYKTSKSMPTQHDIDNDIQLQLYHIVARDLWPNKKIDIAIHNLKYGKIYARHTDASLNSAMNFIEVLYKMILADNEHKSRIPDGECKWCGYHNDCPSYQSIATGTAIVGYESFVPASLDKATEMYEKIQKNISVLEQCKEKLSDYITKYMVSGDINEMSFDLGDKQIRASTTQRSSVVYDFDSVREIFNDRPDFADVVTVKKTAVDKALKGDPKLLRKIQDKASKKFDEPYLRVVSKEKK